MASSRESISQTLPRKILERARSVQCAKYSGGTDSAAIAIVPLRGLKVPWSRNYLNEVENVDISARLVNTALIRRMQIVGGRKGSCSAEKFLCTWQLVSLLLFRRLRVFKGATVNQK